MSILVPSPLPTGRKVGMAPGAGAVTLGYKWKKNFEDDGTTINPNLNGMWYPQVGSLKWQNLK